MPFVTQEHRDKPDLTLPGDRCYVYYARMVYRWKENPRWSTVDEMYEKVLSSTGEFSILNDRVAIKLAWQVFFQKYVMPYENLKEKVNGTI